MADVPCTVPESAGEFVGVLHHGNDLGGTVDQPALAPRDTQHVCSGGGVGRITWGQEYLQDVGQTGKAPWRRWGGLKDERLNRSSFGQGGRGGNLSDIRKQRWWLQGVAG